MNKEKLGVESKIDIIADKFNFEIDKSCRPFQTLKRIIQFRNIMVHAQSHVIIEKTDKMDPQPPKTKWEKLVTINNAEVFKKDTKEILIFLQNKTNMIIHPVIAGGSTTFLSDEELRLNNLSHLIPAAADVDSEQHEK